MTEQIWSPCQECDELTEAQERLAELQGKLESYKLAFKDGQKGRDWLQKNLPSKYLGKNVINAAAEWIVELLAKCERLQMENDLTHGQMQGACIDAGEADAERRIQSSIAAESANLYHEAESKVVKLREWAQNVIDVFETHKDHPVVCQHTKWADAPTTPESVAHGVNEIIAAFLIENRRLMDFVEFASEAPITTDPILAGVREAACSVLKREE